MVGTYSQNNEENVGNIDDSENLVRKSKDNLKV